MPPRGFETFAPSLRLWRRWRGCETLRSYRAIRRIMKSERLPIPT